MKLQKNILSLLLVGAMTIGCLSGCKAKSPSSQSSTPPQSTPATSGEIVQATYPLTTENKTLTVYMKDATSGAVGDWASIKGFEKAMEKLGVTLKFIHPAQGSESDQFNLMIASKEHPDIILWDFHSTPMGMGQLIEEGILLDMDQLIRTYAPNYLSVLQEREDFRKEAVSDNETYPAFYSFSGRAPISGGPTIRGDLLKKYGLDIPVTVDDWTQVMTTLKEKDSNITYPLTNSKNRTGEITFDMLYSAYKTSNSFCLSPDNSELVYGPSTQNYRDYLAKLNEWYEAELLDPEFMANDGTAMNAKLSDGRSVAGSLQLNYHIANITKAAREKNPEFEFAGTTWPVLNKADKAAFFINGGLYFSGSQIAVTSACKDPVLATQVLDYFYSEEGNNLLCWGIEGESYKVNDDGTMSFTDEIMKNPEGKTPQQAILKYAIPLYNFSDVILNDSYVQMVTTMPEQAVARENWLNAESGVSSPKLTVSSENQSEFNMIMNDINTYVQEMQIQFITGQVDLETGWETYVNTLSGMGLDSVLKMQSEAYALYLQR